MYGKLDRKAMAHFCARCEAELLAEEKSGKPPDVVDPDSMLLASAKGAGKARAAALASIRPRVPMDAVGQATSALEASLCWLAH